MGSIEYRDILDVDDSIKKLVRRWRNREDIRSCMINRHIISEEEHSAWLRMLGEKGTLFWVVFYAGTPVGAVYLQNIDHELGECEWGFYIADIGYRGKGISRHMLEFLREYAFVKLKMLRLKTKVLQMNEHALGLYRNEGFSEVAQEATSDGRAVIVMELERKKYVSKKGNSAGYENE